ncbi:MAG: phage integrase N-terminal SAM-like domain-containing protein [Gemmatimonadetes bacterium]|nr:phage integrase N-terminal SAM-like domain-containing protein [Gemmatimonadota bacterium]
MTPPSRRASAPRSAPPGPRPTAPGFSPTPPTSAPGSPTSSAPRSSDPSPRRPRARLRRRPRHRRSRERSSTGFPDRASREALRRAATPSSRTGAAPLGRQPRPPLLLRAEQELKLRGYSPRTRKSYLQHLRRFLRDAGPTPDSITATSIREYLAAVADRGLSRAYHDQVASSIRFLLRYVLERPLLLDAAPRPRKQSRLPQVLSSAELRAFFAAIDNPKHPAALLIAYSAGLRVSEIVRLRVGDLDPERRLSHVRSGTGRKDRHTLLSDVA